MAHPEAEPFVSICIPAYKRPHYLERLLGSIAQQTFRDFEVIVTDDSDTDEVLEVCKRYEKQFPLLYHRNQPALGTPRNWMKGTTLAKGQWIKIIHDDDWLAKPGSLLRLAEAADVRHPLVFCGYDAFDEPTQKTLPRTISQHQFRRVQKTPYLLFADNVLGPPSVLMTHRSVQEQYNPSLKWYVDIEGYMRFLKKYNSIYIDEVLVIMSYNETQVTSYAFGNPLYEVPEALAVLHTAGEKAVRNLVFYDAWWRLLRRLRVRALGDWEQHACGRPTPDFLKQMIAFQRHVPSRWLRIGVLSKVLMVLCYVVRRGWR